MRRSISTGSGLIAVRHRPVPRPALLFCSSVPADFARIARLLVLSAAAVLVGTPSIPAIGQVDLRSKVVPPVPTEAEEISRLVREKNLPGALERADAFLVKNPRDLQVRFLRAVILSDQNKTDDAVSAFEALTQDFPELPEPYNNLAVLHANQGQLDRARSLLQQAIIAQPNYVTAYENLGDVYVSLAAEAYQRALKLDPNNQAAQSKLTLAREISAKLRAVR